jgi:L-malate glycosyltransferase
MATSTLGGGRTSPKLPAVAVLFSQFAPYHVDRIAALARRLQDRAHVLAIEVASGSKTYAWPASQEVAGADKRTLFSGVAYESIPRWHRFVRQFMTLRGCHAVLIGISCDQPDMIALAVALRVTGTRVILMTESKFDDKPRTLAREFGKALLLSVFNGALVGGNRHREYMQFLGFRRRPILLGYDTIDCGRVGWGRPKAPAGDPFSDRPFVFVGRFVEKKGLDILVEAFERYRSRTGPFSRRMVLVGGGELETEVRQDLAARNLEDHVQITGFVDSETVSDHLMKALALVVPSREEQWGLVVNEAVALAIPLIVSEAVGARDELVRNGINGLVVETGDPEALARAMFDIGVDEKRWRRMAAACSGMIPLADTERFATAAAELVRLKERPVLSPVDHGALNSYRGSS